jgi:hypothetical protein
MQQRDKVTDYLSTATERLKADGFSIIENITYKNQTFRCVAKRTRFQAEFFGFVEFFFIFAEFSTIDKLSLKEFSSKCFKYAKKYRSIPLPRGLFEGVNCFPVAVVDNVDSAVAEAVRSEAPPKHWSACEMPVICDLKAKQLYYLEKTPRWGSFYWDYFRAMVISMLSP